MRRAGAGRGRAGDSREQGQRDGSGGRHRGDRRCFPSCVAFAIAFPFSCSNQQSNRHGNTNTERMYEETSIKSTSVLRCKQDAEIRKLRIRSHLDLRLLLNLRLYNSVRKCIPEFHSVFLCSRACASSGSLDLAF